jgi:hypothetical protein
VGAPPELWRQYKMVIGQRPKQTCRLGAAAAPDPLEKGRGYPRLAFSFWMVRVIDYWYLVRINVSQINSKWYKIKPFSIIFNMLKIKAGVGAASRYGSGFFKVMQLRLCNTLVYTGKAYRRTVAYFTHYVRTWHAAPSWIRNWY